MYHGNLTISKRVGCHKYLSTCGIPVGVRLKMLPQFTGSSSSKLVDNISLTDNVNVTSTISKIAMLAEVHLVFLAWDFCLVVQGWMTFELPCCAWVLILADTWRETQGRTRLHRPSRCLRSYIVYPHSLHNPHSLHSLHNLHASSTLSTYSA